MSSKPGDGINHKQYGVTSEGVNVYVDHMIRFLGIDPEKNPSQLSLQADQTVT